MDACMEGNRWLWIHICEVVQGANWSTESSTLEILIPHDVCLVARLCCLYRPNQAAMHWLFSSFLSITCVALALLARPSSYSRGVKRLLGMNGPK